MILEGWKQIADALKYSERHTYRHFRTVSHRLHLKHYLGHGHRMRMSIDEVERFKRLIVSANVRHRRAKVMSENVMLCQTSLFD